MKKLNVQTCLIKCKTTRGIEYVTRVTDSTILTVDNEMLESKWRRSDGVLRGNNSVKIEDNSLVIIEHFIRDRETPNEPGIMDSGFRVKFNGKGVQIYDYPKLKGNKEKWLKELGFRIVSTFTED